MTENHLSLNEAVIATTLNNLTHVKSKGFLATET